MVKLSYCSNVHAVPTVDRLRENLLQYSLPVKEQFSPDEPMGVGLWLPDHAAQMLVKDESKLTDLVDFVRDVDLDVHTFNGFPFGDFHQKVVKLAVYEPTWFEQERLDYTKTLAQLIHRFGRPGQELSISTVPICWRDPQPEPTTLQHAAELLIELAVYLSEFEKEHGRLIYLCIEPEPGCFIQRASDVTEFFNGYLLRSSATEDLVRRHLRVCHDVCHSVVMCETQSEVLSAFNAAGISVGKIQISSAVIADFDSIAESERKLAIEQLASFAEDRYMHQTTIQQRDGSVTFCDDLPEALASVEDPAKVNGVWRIHFHVPVYLETFGHLSASQQAIIDCVSSCREFSDVQHFEVETYAWNVLPGELQRDGLAKGIANEMSWFAALAKQHLS